MSFPLLLLNGTVEPPVHAAWPPMHWNTCLSHIILHISLAVGLFILGATKSELRQDIYIHIDINKEIHNKELAHTIIEVANPRSEAGRHKLGDLMG